MEQTCKMRILNKGLEQVMDTSQPDTTPYLMAERLTGLPIANHEPGRAVWGIPGIGKPGSLHFEILATDRPMNDHAIAEIQEGEFPAHLSRKEMYRLYCKLCQQHAKRANDRVVHSQAMVLFVKRNGKATRMLTHLHKAIERSMARFACIPEEII